MRWRLQGTFAPLCEEVYEARLVPGGFVASTSIGIVRFDFARTVPLYSINTAVVGHELIRLDGIFHAGSLCVLSNTGFVSVSDVVSVTDDDSDSDTADVNHIRAFDHPRGLFIATFKTMSPASHMVMAACRLVFSQRWDGVHALRSGKIRNISADGYGFAHGNAAWPNICSPFLATMYSDALRLFDVRREFLIGEVPHRARNFFSSRDVAVSWTCGHPVLCADDGWYTGYHWAASIKTMV